MNRLSEASLAQLPPEIRRPRYDRRTIRAGVVHLGVGAFHRAHQAVYFENALEAGDLRWGIVGASLRSAAARDALVPQQGLYSLVVRDGDDEDVRVIGAIRDVLVVPERPRSIVDALASPDTHIVTLTITEKGYKLDPASGALIEGDDEVAADLKSLASPRTAPGAIVAGLARRREAELAPFTAISCDNLPNNGSRLRESVLAIARAHDPRLHEWIERCGCFPETMVDRIVPATQAEDVAHVAHLLGVEDRATVGTEPFSQWVIEDRFAGERPDFQALGVQLTASVRPWEEAKLRLLNGAHSAIAYLGGLAGITFVHEFVALPAGRAFIEALWDEATPTLDPPPGLDLDDYRSALMARFGNAALQHRTRQIAMDGSQKLPQRLLAPIADRLQRGEPFDRLALAVAAWMRWQGGRDDGGNRFEVDDPLAARTAQAVADAASPEDQVAGLLAIEAIFPARLADSREFREILTAHLRLLGERGAMEALTCV